MRPTTLDYRAPQPATYRRSLHVATLVTALLAFPLVWMGGLVTSHAAGMSVPDWPNSYGYNMFALPWGLWLGRYAGGTFYEHAHRLLGTLVGLSAFTAAMIAWAPSRTDGWRRAWGATTLIAACSFALTLVIASWLRATARIDEGVYQNSTHAFAGLGALAVAAFVAWRCRGERSDRRWLVMLLLGLVIVQGLLGGLRVTEISLLLAKAHGIFGQLVFATAGLVTLACSRWWIERPIAPSPTLTQSTATLRGWTAAIVVLVFVQLTLGALMRHDPRRTAETGGGGAGLAVPDWPLHYGRVLPPTNAAELDAINADRAYKLDLPPTTLGDVWLHVAHRLGAYMTATTILAFAAFVSTRHRDAPTLARNAVMLAALVLVQVSLGVLTVLYRKPADLATAHQATGALLLMKSATLLARTWRLYPPAARHRQNDDASEPSFVSAAAHRTFATSDR